MIILGIETSCDETAAAVLEQKNNRIQILSNVIGTSAQLQEKYGGIIPEQAAREQLKLIIPVIQESLRLASLAQGSPIGLDAIAVTYGPGLIGSLLVGVETAKTLSLIWNKPLIPINHLIGHFYANWIANDSSLRASAKQSSQETNPTQIASSTLSPHNDVPGFPCLGLLVSGGHTDLVLFTDHGKYKYLGGTRDDAVGECFDKCARLIGYPYPGGPKISKIAEKGNPKEFKLPRPMLQSKDFDFSFSGLKTAFANLVQQNFKLSSIDPKNADAHWKHIALEGNPAKEEQKLADLCASLQQAIIDSLIEKTILAAQKYKVDQIMMAGGVAANQKLKQSLESRVKSLGKNIYLHIPPPELCTDNGAMIASAAFFSPRFAGEAGQKPIKDPLSLQADPNLSLS